MVRFDDGLIIPLMLLYVIAIIAGFAVLVWSADRFVLGASALARNLGVSSLIVGMIIIGFGTSAPEMFVAAVASLNQNPGLALGNAIGSNIANIGLVLGIGALITPLTVQSQTLKREYPVLLLITIILLTLLWDQELSRLDGLLLLVGTVIMISWLTWLSRSSGEDPLAQEIQSELPDDMSTGRASAWTLAGLVLLVGSSHLLVWGATHVATALGISELVIGLTIIAVGTSLPEIAVAISAALKKEHDIVIGNVIGSNMFNSLAVIGVGSSITPFQFPDVVLLRDYSTMAALTLALLIMAYGFRGPGRINRVEASLLLAAYVGYMVSLYITEAA